MYHMIFQLGTQVP